MQHIPENRYNLESAIQLRQQSIESIKEVQFSLLKSHLQQALTTSFYKKRYSEYGVDVQNIQSVQDLSCLPYTTREDLDEYPGAFGLQDKKLFRDYALTSGTTGEPVIVPYTVNDLNRLAFNEAVAFHGTGVTKEESVLLTVTLDRCFIAGIAYYSGVIFLGATAIRSGPGQPARQWHIINKLQPEVIVGVPTFLKALGQWAVENGVDIKKSSVHSLVTIGEPIRKPDHELSALGQDLENLWGAKIYSSYGATEFETAFCECREFVGGHVHPELMLVEIVDESGNICSDGVAGEVVVTPLGVEGFPLVRFKTGDIARMDSSPCKCGWNTPRLGPLEGRLSQRLKYKGTTFYPETVFHALQDFMHLQHAYIEVRSAAEGSDEITVVVGSDNPTGDVSQIEEKLQAHLRVKPVVVIKGSDEVYAVMNKDGGRKAKKFFDLR